MDETKMVANAITSIRPSAEFIVGETSESLNWLDKIQDKPTEKEFDEALEAEKLAYSNNEYARNRQAEYPSIEELVVALYDLDDKSAIEAKRAEVKAKYPKPE